MEKNKYSRKEFFRTITGGALSVSLANIFIAGCTNAAIKQKEVVSNPAASKNCEDMTGLTENEINLRQHLGYESISSTPERLCINCSLYIKPSSPENCGGCMLFKGPVNAEASCIQFAVKK